MTRLLGGNITHVGIGIIYITRLWPGYSDDNLSEEYLCLSLQPHDTFTRLCLAVLDRRIFFSSRIARTAELVVPAEVFLIDISAILLLGDECGRWWAAESNVNKLWPSCSVTKTVRVRPQISACRRYGRHPVHRYSGNFAEAPLRCPRHLVFRKWGTAFILHTYREWRWDPRYSRRDVFTLADTAPSSVIISWDIMKLYVEAEFIENIFRKNFTPLCIT